ncbi:MAG: hypothetical protein Q7K11_01695 [Candidatus Berkelbacteria bacterium]|nr:hypothetical protein [Candidatus Berkelbacteria bacterium]
MKIKKTLSLALIAITLLTIAMTVISAGVNAEKLDQVKGKKLTREAAAAEGKLGQNQLDTLKAKGIKMIEKRVSELYKTLDRIQKDKNLTSEEKTSLANEINAAIASLNSLTAKIKSDTNIADLRNDVKKIVDESKIFSNIVPKVRLLIAIDNLQNLSVKIADLTPKIQKLIDDLKSSGKDVAKLQSLVDSINSRLKIINTTLSNDKALIMGVTASSASSKTTFNSVRKDLADVRFGFAKIREDIAQMRSDFKIIIKTSSASAKPKED